MERYRGGTAVLDRPRESEVEEDAESFSVILADRPTFAFEEILKPVCCSNPILVGQRIVINEATREAHHLSCVQGRIREYQDGHQPSSA